MSAKKKNRQSTLPKSVITGPKKAVKTTKSTTPPKRKRSDSTVQNVYSARWRSILQLIFLLFCGWFWAIRYSEFLYVSQFSDLFRYNTGYLLEKLSRVGGGHFLLTSFWIQFFYYPTIGALFMTLFLWGIQRATARFFQLEKRQYLLSFLPPLLLMTMLISANYCIYDLVAIPKLYGIVPGILLALIMGLIYVGQKNLTVRLILLAVMTGILFPLCGYYALLGGVFCFIGETRFPDVQMKRNLRLEIIFLLILAIPVLWYPCFYRTSAFAAIYYDAVIPSASLLEDYVSAMGIYWGFLVGVHLFYLLLAWRQVRTGFWGAKYGGSGTVSVTGTDEASGKSTESAETVLSETDSTDMTSSPDENNVLEKTDETETVETALENALPEPSALEPVASEPAGRFSLARHEWVGILFLLMGMFASVLISCHTDGFLRTLQMFRYLESNNWDKLIEIKTGGTQPVRPTIALYNLALFEKGMMGEHVFDTTQNGVVIPSLIKVSTYRIYGDKLLYRTGLLNYAARITTNKYVSRPESAQANRMFVRIAAIRGEAALADRFLVALEQTLFHSRWARPWRNWFRLQEGLSEAELVKKYPDFSRQGVDQIDAEIKKIRSRLPTEDYFTEVLLPEFNVLEIAQHDGFAKMTLEMQELYLSCALLSRGKTAFMKHIDEYIARLGNRPLPRYFQEALLLFRFQKNGEVGGSYYPWSPGLVTQMHAYLDLHVRHQRDRENPELVAEKKKFEHTFWGYYIDVPEAYYY